MAETRRTQAYRDKQRSAVRAVVEARKAAAAPPKEPKFARPQRQQQYLCYAEERADKVLVEMATEMERESPNWTYVDLLQGELEYWMERIPESGCFSMFARLFWPPLGY
jgi:hypothetical protein